MAAHEQPRRRSPRARVQLLRGWLRAVARPALLLAACAALVRVEAQPYSWRLIADTALGEAGCSDSTRWEGSLDLAGCKARCEDDAGCEFIQHHPSTNYCGTFGSCALTRAAADYGAAAKVYAWGTFSDCSAGSTRHYRSCKGVQAASSGSAGSGVTQLLSWQSASQVPSSSTPPGPLEVYCDQSTGGGGWTLVASSANPLQDRAQPAWHSNLQTLSPSGSMSGLWDTLRGVFPEGGDLRVSCKAQSADAAFAVDMAFHETSWCAAAAGNRQTSAHGILTPSAGDTGTTTLARRARTAPCALRRASPAAAARPPTAAAAAFTSPASRATRSRAATAALSPTAATTCRQDRRRRGAQTC